MRQAELVGLEQLQGLPMGEELAFGDFHKVDELEEGVGKNDGILLFIAADLVSHVHRDEGKLRFKGNYGQTDLNLLAFHGVLFDFFRVGVQQDV